MADKTNPEVSVVPTQAEQEMARAILQALDTDEHIILALSEMQDGGGYKFTRYFARLLAARLAHQTPPATQPIATVGEVERNLEAQRQTIEACARVAETQTQRSNRDDESDEAYQYGVGYEQGCADAAAAIRALRPNEAPATLHTPPPVATATVVDAEARAIIEDLLTVFVDEGESGYGLVERAKDFLAATTTPPAGGQ